MAESTVDPDLGGADRYGGAGRSADAPSGEASPETMETPGSPGAAFSELGRQLGEAWLFVGYYLRTRLDQLRLSIFRLILFSALGMIGLLAAGAMVVTAAAMIVLGLAHLIGWLSGYAWIGELATGVLLLGIMLGITYVGIARATKTSRLTTMAAHERRLREQREYYGTDVNERAYRN
jgi:hypothetical protein